MFALLEQVPIGSYVFRLEDPPHEDSLRIVFANSASEEALGLAPSTVIGTLIGEWFPNSGETTGVAAAYRDVVLDQASRDFGVISYADEAIGSSRYALSAHPLGADVVVIFFENLSASSEERRELAAIVESATDAILSKDLHGTILSWNRSAERTYGYSAAEAIGRNVSMLLPPDRPSEVDEMIARLRTGERVDQFETQRVCKDGTVIDVSLTISPLTDIRGEVVGAATIARDITKLKEDAKQLQWLAAIVAASEDAITSRTTDGILLSWNPGAERLFGYTAEEMIGRPVSVLDPPELDDDVLEIRKRIERGERRVAPYEAAVRRKDGSEVHVSISSSPIADETGRLVAIASVMRDVTDQRRLEEQLRQSQKMEAIGSLAGGVAHDFNNILTVIRTASESVLAELADGGARDKVKQIDLAAEHAASLTGQLLAFSRQQVLLPEELDLNAIVVSTSGMAARLIGEHVQVELSLQPDIPPIEIDRGQLQQVIINLFVNARDAMPERGKLNVRTSIQTLDQAYVVEHLDVPAGEYVLLEITDSGKGMDAETTRRIFDPFFTTKAEGTGLGLATVFGIVKQSGGQIFVYSELGLGTTFKIYLPPSAGVAPRAVTGSTDEVAPQGGKETILLVEDADLLRPLIIEVFATTGYTVLAAANGNEALAIFEDYEGRIDLLLTDVIMPGMGGRELAERVVAKAPTIKIVFTSGYPDDSSIGELLKERHVTFIQKPYTGSELLRTIRAVLGDPG